MVILVRTSASGILGVITAAKGSSRVVRAVIASSASSLLPLVETITGSTTIFTALYSFSLWAIIRIISGFETIPILTAAGGMSEKIASSSAATKSAGASCMANTPVVF